MSAGSGFDPRVPFTRAEALQAGITPAGLRGRDYVRLHRNVYVSRRVTRTLAVRARAALKVAPAGTVVSHHPAALLWGGTVPGSAEIHVRIPIASTLQMSGIRTHEIRGTAAVSRRVGLPVTSPEQTFLDMATYLDLVQLVVLADRLVRRGVTTPERLLAAARAWSGPNSAVLRRAAGLVRCGVDSAPESRLRMLMVLAGFPEPVVNHVIRDDVTGDWLRRFELAYPELRLAVEYEGRLHREEDEVWDADIERREDLDRRSWRVVQVISKGLFDNPLRTLQRIDQARVDRGASSMLGFAEEWRRYFPGQDVT
jgi:hypothetical protein